MASKAGHMYFSLTFSCIFPLSCTSCIFSPSTLSPLHLLFLAIEIARKNAPLPLKWRKEKMQGSVRLTCSRGVAAARNSRHNMETVGMADGPRVLVGCPVGGQTSGAEGAAECWPQISPQFAAPYTSVASFANRPGRCKAGGK